MGPIYDMVTSGARSSLQLGQMTGMKAMINQPGKSLIFRQSTTKKDWGYGIFHHHSRRQKRRGRHFFENFQAGYLTRRLVGVSHDVVVTEEDCGEKEGIVVSEAWGGKLRQEIFFRISAGLLPPARKH